MRTLFVQGGSRIKIDSNNNLFVDGNFNNKILDDYFKLSDECVFLLRKDSKKYDDKILEKKFNRLDSKFNIKLLSDVYVNTFSRFNISNLRKLDKIIKEEVKKSDKIIIRSIGNFYTNTVYKYCLKYKKVFIIEVTGLAFEGSWYHSLKGKLVAPLREIKLRNAVKKAPYVLYVTNEALQKRYPTKNKSIGCSDVRIDDIDILNLNNRIKKYSNYKNNERLKLGTIAFLDVKWKGQFDVIKALYILKNKYNIVFDYYLVGSGTGKNIKKVIKKYELEDQVHIIGPMEHKEIFKFLNTLDVYIQPSYREGLCRSIVEAMSTSCPVISSDAGGNFELVNSKFIFKKGRVNEIVKILSKLNKEDLISETNRSYKESQKYNKKSLERIRDEFYNEFIKEKIND